MSFKNVFVIILLVCLWPTEVTPSPFFDFQPTVTGNSSEPEVPADDESAIVTEILPEVPRSGRKAETGKNYIMLKMNY